MMKKALLFCCILAIAVTAAGCGAKTLHCDNCGKEVKVSDSSNMEEDWIIYCSDCEKELGLDKVVEER